MTKLNCIRCGGEVEINIANAQDENGEVFVCPHCGFKFRYTDQVYG